MRKASSKTYGILIGLLCLTLHLYGQEPDENTRKRYRVVGGVMQEVVAGAETESRRDSLPLRDSLLLQPGDSIKITDSGDTIRFTRESGELLPEESLESLPFPGEGDNRVVDFDSLKPQATDRELTDVDFEVDDVLIEADTLIIGKRAQRRLDRAADTTFVRYSRLFRDTMPISRVVGISVIAPGFSQLYNKQAWKIPILYGVTGSLAYFGFKENKEYKKYNNLYESIKAQKDSKREDYDAVQTSMIKHNTARTVLLMGAMASYLYFLGDGTLNYNGPTNHVKTATTLSTIFPGAGQIYNRSYWKAPIVLGAMTTMVFIIDWNARGYKRFRTAYNIMTDGNTDTVDEFDGGYPADHLKTLKNNYRRNRDLAIILTGLVYVLNIVDAHVEAHMKDFDISDDLSWNLQPTMMNMYTMTHRNINGYGLTFTINF